MPEADGRSARDGSGHLLLRGPAQEGLSRTEEWQTQMQPMVHRALDALSFDHPADLLADFAIPWCLQIALLVVQADPADSPLKPQAAAATAELIRLFEDGPMPMGEPAFVEVSQTSPRMLANLWLALFSNPREWDRLRSQPALWPGAGDELLRYAGIVRRIRREARAGVELAGIAIAERQRVMLLLASANRDPDQFADADRLDVSRRIAGQVALGEGRNSCIGAALILWLIAVSTRALLQRFRQCDCAASRNFARVPTIVFQLRSRTAGPPMKSRRRSQHCVPIETFPTR